jgi:Tfp pilus assembly protein PilP
MSNVGSVFGKVVSCDASRLQKKETVNDLVRNWESIPQELRLVGNTRQFFGLKKVVTA